MIINIRIFLQNFILFLLIIMTLIIHFQSYSSRFSRWVLPVMVIGFFSRKLTINSIHLTSYGSSFKPTQEVNLFFFCLKWQYQKTVLPAQYSSSSSSFSKNIAKTKTYNQCCSERWNRISNRIFILLYLLYYSKNTIDLAVL